MKLSLQQIQNLGFDSIPNDVIIEIIDIPEVNDSAASTSSEDKIDTMVASTSSNNEKSITKPAFQKQINLQRDHSSITSSKRWVGGVRKWQFLMIYSTVSHQRVGWVGLKKSKT